IVPRADWTALLRLHAIAGELTRRYPDDFESWYLMGEARFHFGQPFGVTTRQTLEAFDRAIANDSSFAPSYIHPIELSFLLGEPELADRYARSYLRLDPTDVSASGVKLIHRILEARSNGAQALDTLLGSAAPSALEDARLALRRWGDSSETAIALARALLAAPTGDAPWLSREGRERRMGVTLLYRGHLREALRHLEHNPATIPADLVEAALLGAPWDSATATFREWLAGPPPIVPSLTLPWWAARRDTATIQGIERKGDSVAHSAANPLDRNIGLYTSAAAQAYLALVRGDTAGALRRFEATPDSLCAYCYLAKLTRAQLLSATRQDSKADRLLEGWLLLPSWPSEVLWTMERGRVAERLGERAKAAESYQYVADVWRHADPELQPYVAEAKQGLERITGER
ncbi:MAG TPA: hypothetical protein VFX42_11080, partial [Gemmatimonadales bacterium]|nr:hypothetical protein [Gemmatimonadales bacterium]